MRFNEIGNVSEAGGKNSLVSIDQFVFVKFRS